MGILWVHSPRPDQWVGLSTRHPLTPTYHKSSSNARTPVSAQKNFEEKFVFSVRLVRVLGNGIVSDDEVFVFLWLVGL